MAEENAHEDGADPGADEAFDGFLGRDLDERGAAKGDATEVGKDVVCNDQRGGHKEPKDAGKDVVDDKVALDHDQQQGHVRNAELHELEAVVVFLERVDKENESDNVQAVGKEAVMNGQRQQKVVNQDDVLEIVNHGLSFQKVNGCSQKVPIERPAPGQVFLTRRLCCQVDDFLEGKDLDQDHESNEPDVTSSKRDKKASNHDEGPNGSDYKVLFFLFLFACGVLFCCWNRRRGR